MTTTELFDRLTHDGQLSDVSLNLVLDTAYISRLGAPTQPGGAGLQVARAIEACNYFAGTKLRVNQLNAFAAPAAGERIRLTGTGNVAPFDGLRMDLQLWTEQLPSGVSEFRFTLSAYGTPGRNTWTLGQGFPFYKDSLLGRLTFALIDDAKYPLLTLSSHPLDNVESSGVFCKGMLDLNSVLEASPKLFLGDGAKDKAIFTIGTISTFPPSAEDAAPEISQPSFSFYAVVPDQEPRPSLGALFPVRNIGFAMQGVARYSTATRKWTPDCSLIWSAELDLNVPTDSTGQLKKSYTIPIGMEIKRKDGPIRFWSDLTDGVFLAWDGLSRCIPKAPFSLPSEFELRDEVKLTQLEMMVGRKENREVWLQSVSLDIQTNEDKNRWVLIDGLLTLDAIEFSIVVYDPAGTPSISLKLSGLIGIGANATLRLTGDFSHSGGHADYGFSGQLTDDAPLSINEVLSHFLGHSDYPAIPEITVDDFSFSVRPKSKIYDGLITLSANWDLPEKISLHDVRFHVHHDAGEGDTTVEASGVFEIGDLQIYVSADYVSSGEGWTFSGGTLDDDEVLIGDWIGDVWGLLFGETTNVPPLPAAVRGLTLLNLGARINTTTKEYSFQGTAKFPIDGNKQSDSSALITIQVDIDATPDHESATFRGYLSLMGREFEVVFDSSGLLVASYVGSTVTAIDLKDLVKEISAELAKSVAEGITLNLSHAQLVYDGRGGTSKFLFGVEVDAGVKLSNLPVVGSLFDRDQTLTIVFNLLAASGTFDKAAIQSVNNLTGPETSKLPEEPIGGPKPEFRLKAAVNVSGETRQLDLPMTTGVQKSENSAQSKPVIDSGGGGSRIYRWVKIEKQLGPFYFQRMGLATDGTIIAFLIDASLKTAGLTLTLDGLGANCTIAQLGQGNFQPRFELSGLGVDFKSGGLEIAGALIRRPGEEDAYDGAVVIHYKQFGIEALGSYQKIGPNPSLFVYALIDYPLGGPAFFYVEGGAIGFGYNRTMSIPSIEAVADFPLVKRALSSSRSTDGPIEVARELSAQLRPVAGQYFVAVGIKFNSYKTIQGFVLLTVLFGDHFEIDVLGKATLTSPPKPAGSEAPSMVSASLLLLGRYVPEDGLVMVRAQLAPDAHLFSPDCHITGGFALYSWFDKEHKGDFVLTIGGYHKSFQVPDYYPKVPRVGLNWRVNENLAVKAEAYFALTPSAIMAGGKLEATWKSGNLQAWFHAEVDFLIGWQPYYYEGSAYVSIGARYKFEFFGSREITAELTAELEVWGPPFSGRARVQWNVISLEIAFGNKERTKPQAIKWPEFRKSFLPADRMYVATVERGKMARNSDSAPVSPESDSSKQKIQDLGVINPRELSIVVTSPLPVKTVYGPLLLGAREATTDPIAEPVLGIAPMQKKSGDWGSKLQITISYRPDASSSFADTSDQFIATRIRTSVPASLWDQEMDRAAKPNQKPLLKNAITGYAIRPRNPIGDAPSLPINAKSANQHNKDLVRGRRNLGFVIGVGPGIVIDPQEPSARRSRKQLLNDILPEADSDWSMVTVAAWKRPPQIVRIGN